MCPTVTQFEFQTFSNQQNVIKVQWKKSIASRCVLYKREELQYFQIKPDLTFGKRYPRHIGNGDYTLFTANVLKH